MKCQPPARGINYYSVIYSIFLKQYERGLTPNPDIMCNRVIKFDRLIEHSWNHLHADAIATGHYARTNQGDSFLRLTEEDVQLNGATNHSRKNQGSLVDATITKSMLNV